MMQNKILFGITGGSGSGKTSVSHIIRSMDIEVIDCDIIARDIAAKGTPCLMELKAEFGDDIIDQRGELIRKKLGRVVFSDPLKLQRLNEITHKYIIDEVLKRAGLSKSRLVGIDGAVLFESGLSSYLSKIIGVICPPQERIRRIMKRDGLTEEEANIRINSQKDNEFYEKNCDYIIYNSAEIENLSAKVKEVVEQLATSIEYEDEKK